MSAHRFFVAPSSFEGESVRLDPEQSHQVCHVLRLKTGDRITVLDESGSEYDVVLPTADPKSFFFLGAGLALRKNLHVGFELLRTNLPGRMRTTVEAFVHFCILFFFLEIFWGSLLATPPSLNQIEGSLSVSRFWGVVAVPIGVALLIYHEVVVVVQRFWPSDRAQAG
jgi:hypothetical protein